MNAPFPFAVLAAAFCLTPGHTSEASTNAAPRRPQLQVIPLPRYRHLDTNQFLVPASPPVAGQLRPGVYESKPYTCIVVVPSGTEDPRSVIKPKEPVPVMPMVRPDLYFVPRGSGKK